VIDVYLEKSPAALKVPVMLEECGISYRIIHVSVSKGEQHRKEFRAISPNDKVPVIVDHEPSMGGGSLPVFESGAIILYLAERSGKFLSNEPRKRLETIQWLFWQAAGLSPMSGQAIHFTRYASPEAQPYGLKRYRNEVNRLYGVLNQRLSTRNFICEDYSIADIGSYTWTVYAEQLNQNLEDFPHLKRWREDIAKRPAVVRAYERALAELKPPEFTEEEMYRNLFGNTASSLGLI
jgi:GSH-dependent disulfide-bond oxidoreductase